MLLFAHGIETKGYWQVGVWDADSAGPPMCPLGTEVAALNSGIAVATGARRADTGVAIEIWVGDTPSLPPLRQAHRGLLTWGQHGVVVGCHAYGDVHRVDLPPGVHRVHVYTDRVFGGISIVRFAFPHLVHEAADPSRSQDKGACGHA